MNVSDKLTPQQLKVIAMKIYKIGQDSKDMQAKDLIEEIKTQILSAIRS